MADHVTHIGVSGSGLVTKIVHNCASQATRMALTGIVLPIDARVSAMSPHFSATARRLDGQRQEGKL